MDNHSHEKSHGREILFIRIGLAAVFLANALTAAFNPGEFIELIEQSSIGIIIPSAIALKIIVVNDSIMALLILFGWRWSRLIFSWAMVWIGIVILALGNPLAILEESGFLFMALALFFHVQNYKSNN